MGCGFEFGGVGNGMEWELGGGGVRAFIEARRPQVFGSLELRETICFFTSNYKLHQIVP